jgi:hypothetical protein
MSYSTDSFFTIYVKTQYETNLPPFNSTSSSAINLFIRNSLLADSNNSVFDKFEELDIRDRYQLLAHHSSLAMIKRKQMADLFNQLRLEFENDFNVYHFIDELFEFFAKGEILTVDEIRNEISSFSHVNNNSENELIDMLNELNETKQTSNDLSNSIQGTINEAASSVKENAKKLNERNLKHYRLNKLNKLALQPMATLKKAASSTILETFLQENISNVLIAQSSVLSDSSNPSDTVKKLTSSVALGLTFQFKKRFEEDPLNSPELMYQSKYGDSSWHFMLKLSPNFAGKPVRKIRVQINPLSGVNESELNILIPESLIPDESIMWHKPTYVLFELNNVFMSKKKNISFKFLPKEALGGTGENLPYINALVSVFTSYSEEDRLKVLAIFYSFQFYSSFASKEFRTHLFTVNNFILFLDQVTEGNSFRYSFGKMDEVFNKYFNRDSKEFVTLLNDFFNVKVRNYLHYPANIMNVNRYTDEATCIDDNYLLSLADRAHAPLKKFGVGVEFDEFVTATNSESLFKSTVLTHFDRLGKIYSNPHIFRTGMYSDPEKFKTSLDTLIERCLNDDYRGTSGLFGSGVCNGTLDLTNLELASKKMKISGMLEQNFGVGYLNSLATPIKLINAYPPLINLLYDFILEQFLIASNVDEFKHYMLNEFGWNELKHQGIDVAVRFNYYISDTLINNLVSSSNGIPNAHLQSFQAFTKFFDSRESSLQGLILHYLYEESKETGNAVIL